MSVAVVGAVEAEETGGEVAAAEDVADGGEDVGPERPHGGAVAFFVADEEGVPGGGEDLGRGEARGRRGRWRAQRMFRRRDGVARGLTSSSFSASSRT